jgi:small subunit ribosomal protein S20
LVESPKSIADKKRSAEKKKRKQTSAEKQIKQSEKRRLRNKAVLTRLKNMLKHLRTLTTRQEAEAFLPKVYSALDKARKQGLLDARNASRQKSRLTLAVKKLA